MLDKRLWVVLLTVFLDLLGFGIVIPILPLYAQTMHASYREIGGLLAIYSVMQLFFAPLWGRLSELAGRRPILLVSIAGSCLSQLGYALAPSFVWLVVARGVAGVCGANISAAQAYVADVTTERDRAAGMGMLGAALGLGFVFGPALGGILSQNHTTLPYFVAAACAGINFIAALLFLEEPRSAGERTKARALSIAGLKKTFGAPRLWTALLLYFVVTFGFSNLEATFSLFVDGRFGYGRRDVAWLFAYIGVIIIIVQGGFVRRLVPRYGEKKMIVAGALLQAFGFVALWQAHALGTLFFGLGLTSVGNALSTPSLSSLISRLAGREEQGGVLGVSQSAGALARISGPLIGTSVLVLGLGMPYLVGAVVLFVAALFTSAVVHQPAEAT